MLQAAPNLDGVADFDVAGRLRAAFAGAAMRIEVDNDATCATLAEWQLGAGRRRRRLVLVTLGTGIGGGLVVDGELVPGPTGSPASSVTWSSIPTGRRARAAGAAAGSATHRGPGWRCWPAKRRSPGVARRSSNWPGRRRRTCAASTSSSPRRAGDGDALAVIDEFARWVALGLVNLTNVLDPEMFVLGGGLAAGADLYLDADRGAGSASCSTHPHLRPIPRIAFATSGERAGAIGAALVAASDRLSLDRVSTSPVDRSRRDVSVAGVGGLGLRSPPRPRRGRRARAADEYLPGSSALYTSKKCWISLDAAAA